MAYTKKGYTNLNVHKLIVRDGILSAFAVLCFCLLALLPSLILIVIGLQLEAANWA
jgi:hypothetical protein